MPLTLNADGESYATAVTDIRGTNRSEVINKTSVSGGNRERRLKTGGNACVEGKVEEEKMGIGESLRVEFKKLVQKKTMINMRRFRKMSRTECLKVQYDSYFLHF